LGDDGRYDRGPDRGSADAGVWRYDLTDVELSALTATFGPSKRRTSPTTECRDRLTRSHGAGAARGRDGAGDNVACKHALAEVQRVMALKDLSLAPTGCRVFVINS
jgi:hypothetical protein